MEIRQAVKLEDVRFTAVDTGAKGEQRTLLLADEIPGAAVYFHSLPAGASYRVPAQQDHFVIFFLLTGEASFTGRGKSVTYAEKAFYTDLPSEETEVSALRDATFLEICWEQEKEDFEELEKSKDAFPLTAPYEDTVQYRDFFKSETTISRQIVKQSLIPRFAFGSVEANADDLVGMHAHPLLDQFFFTFDDNDMDVLIDCRILPLKGNTLLHIPLGSNHGVIAKGSQRMHYLWLDFIPPVNRVSAVAYLDETHTETGVKQTL